VTLPGEEPVADPKKRYWVLPGPAIASAETPVPTAAAPAAAEPVTALVVPGTLAIVGRGLDLNVAASGRIRRASVYIGLMWLLSAGPIAAVSLAFSARQGGFEWLRRLDSGRLHLVPVGPYFELLFLVVVLVGIGCLVLLSVDAQLLATILIGAEAAGRRIELGDALRLGRMTFWRFVRVSILVGFILLIPRVVVNVLVLGGRPVGSDAQTLTQTVVNIILSAPFAYVATGIVLGGVTARESVRRSWMLARFRWRLAFLIAIVNAAVAYIASFALGAGADILVRLGTLFGLGTTMGQLQLIVLGAIVALAIVSIGSLVMTIAALTVAPQVVAFLGLTGYSAGLDASRGPADPQSATRVEPLISRPMKIALAISAAAAILAVLSAI
jgi:hypothetical protein